MTHLAGINAQGAVLRQKTSINSRQSALRSVSERSGHWLSRA